MNTPVIISKKDHSIILVDFDERDPIYVHDLGWHKTSPKHSFGPAVRDYYLLHLVKSGIGFVERNGIPVIVQANEAFLIRPGEVTTYYAHEDEPWEYYWIAFNGTFAKTLLSETTDKLFIRHQKSGILALQSAIECKTVNKIDLLSTLLTVLKSIRTETNKPTSSSGLDVAVRYLENNYFQEIDVGALAKSLGYSRAYFTTLFAEKTSESPYRYLMNVRLEKAKELLQESDHSVEEIAFSVGFSCIGRFSEQFKKHTGLSPLQFRNHYNT